jgi:hypothetical protein
MRPIHPLIAAALAIALATPAVGQVVSRPKAAPRPACPSVYSNIQSEAREIQADFIRAEAQGAKPDACVRAKLYIRTMARLVTALEATPAGCPPANPALLAQYYQRERVLWQSKANRNCTAATGLRQQHKILRVEPPSDGAAQ